MLTNSPLTKRRLHSYDLFLAVSWIIWLTNDWWYCTENAFAARVAVTGSRQLLVAFRGDSLSLWPGLHWVAATCATEPRMVTSRRLLSNPSSIARMAMSNRRDDRYPSILGFPSTRNKHSQNFSLVLINLVALSSSRALVIALRSRLAFDMAFAVEVE
jgi:hypothetical protein